MLNIKKVDSLPAEVQRSDTLLLSTSDGKIRLDDGTNSYPLGGAILPRVIAHMVTKHREV